MHSLHCPRCSAILWSRPLPAGSGHACGTCGGVWLDGAAAQHVTHVLCGETLGHADIASRTSAHRVDTQSAIACPICRATLQRTRVGQAGVDVDYCTQHGTWFDKDELGRVAQSFATARAYGGAGAVAAGAGVAGVAVAGTALAASQSNEVRRFANELDPEDAADALELAVDGGSAALEVGAAVGDAVDVGEVAGGVFELLGGLFEGFS